jgi:hypothetical protein
LLRLPVFEHAISQASEILAPSQVLDAPATKQARDAARELLETATRAKLQADAQVDQAQRELEREEKLNEVATSLSLLVEHGEKLGLNSDHCPLCAAARTVEEFEAGLAAARSRIESLASGITLARSQLSAAREAAVDTNAAHANAMAAWEAIERQEADLAARERAHVELFQQHNLDLRLLKDPEGLEKELTAERDHLIELDRALQTLEASQTVSRIATLDDRVAVCRRDLDVAADHLAQSQAGMTAARAIERGIRRVTGEIIDERLAQISPLLNELYQRLRPHSDWRTIEYSIRGDVRRFLSLKVGDGLNPQFVFSSGQRRAVGLAFLLSVHLARAWTSWRTLVLDDPVQHIDDFRALHLVEVLAALRLDGRQIICAVEDAALADLLCRRLLSTQDEPGRRYDIDLGGEDSAAVMKRQEVLPMQKGILQDVSALHVAS